MKIRKKIVTMVIMFLVLVIIAMALYINLVLLNSYVNLEEKKGLKDMLQIKEIITTRETLLNRNVLDWAVWDDTYNYIENRNNNYIFSSISESSFINLKINMIYILDKEYNPIYLRNFDYEKNRDIRFPKEFIEKIKKRKQDSGLVILDGSNALFFSVAPVYDNVKSKDSNGYFGMAYYITPEVLREIVNEAKMPLSLNFTFEKKSSEIKYRITSPNNSYLNCAIDIPDALHNDVLTINTEMPRDIYNIGKLNVQIFSVFLLVMSAAFLTAVLLILKKLLWVRIQKLNDGVNRLSFDGDTTNIRLELEGNDELTELKESINMMLDKIDMMTNKISSDEERYRALYEETAAIHLMVDENYKIRDTNKIILNVLGYTKEEFLTKQLEELIYPEDIDKITGLIEAIVLGEAEGSIEVRFIAKDLKICTILLYPTNLFISENDNTYSILITGTDLTDRKEMEKKLEEFAAMDSMTGILNRRMGMEILEKYMNFSNRYKESLTVCFIDVNGLKAINDKYGHNMGDDLIKETSRVIKETIRESDIICRLGGDEFLIIFPKCNMEMARGVWKRVLASADIINSKEDKPYKISMSHGFAEYDGKMSLDELVETADDRMYEEKKRIKKALGE